MKHVEYVQKRMERSREYERAYGEASEQLDLALLVREMREHAHLTQSELARKADTTQSVIARMEDADYDGQSLPMLERIAAACNVTLTLHAEGQRFKRDAVLTAV